MQFTNSHAVDSLFQCECIAAPIDFFCVLRSCFELDRFFLLVSSVLSTLLYLLQSLEATALKIYAFFVNLCSPLCLTEFYLCSGIHFQRNNLQTDVFYCQDCWYGTFFVNYFWLNFSYFLPYRRLGLLALTVLVLSEQ